MRHLFLDTAVLLYAFGGPSPHRDHCLAVLQAARAGQVQLHLSVEGGQEFLFHRLRRGPLESALEAFDAVDAVVEWHPFGVEVLRASRRMVADGEARGRDAVHAATALLAGFGQIVSPDPDFDGIRGLRRLDPGALRPST